MRSGTKSRDASAENSGVLLYAKRPGVTSFSSLWTIKHALNTGRVGHTGTLDSFAEGLLVVLTGRLTRLVTHITESDKTYRAVVMFGSETDTLDPTGSVVRTAPCPSEEAVRSVLPAFTGSIMQVPPAYSAVHVDGRRASDVARSGGSAEIPARNITVYSLTLDDFSAATEEGAAYALLTVRCSKGTYIRALARDIAAACGSAAHLIALRRTEVGPFKLEDAVGAAALGEFSIAAARVHAEKTQADPRENTAGRQSDAPAKIQNSGAGDCSGGEPDSREAEFTFIRNALRQFTPDEAADCGFACATLAADFEYDFRNGRPLYEKHFIWTAGQPADGSIAVFYSDGSFAGVMNRTGRKLSYGFVIPRGMAPAQHIRTFSWGQIVSGQFPQEYAAQGTALTIGSFDGPHIGHDSLFSAVLAQKGCAGSSLVPGIVTFTRSLRGLKNPEIYKGDVATLAQRLEICEQKGFAFAVVIDFSGDFGRMEGHDFLSILARSCGMKFLAEGRDFHCGYRGAVGMDQIRTLAPELGFRLEQIDPVLYQNERVSSSRIREDVIAGNFAPAQFMLNRRFALDCTGRKWECVPESGKYFLESPRATIQVLPEKENCEVLVILSGTASLGAEPVHTFKSYFSQDSGKLRLLVPVFCTAVCIRKIEFLS